jgi:hypothetical protein
MAEAAASQGEGAAVDAVVAPAVEATAAPVATAAPAAQATLLGGDPPADPAAAPPEREKPAVEAKATDGLPETYEVAIPEGEVIDQTRLDAYQGVLKEAKLTQDQANTLTPFLLAQKKAMEQQAMDAWADQTKSWRTSVEADPEIGGAKLRDTLVNAARARDAYGSPELKALLVDGHLGIGNHPAIVKLLARVGAAMGEDLRGADRQFGGGSDSRDKSAEAIGARMFPGRQ